MATENTLFTNQFTKGMNTDTSYQMMSNEAYTYGENIRIFSVNNGANVGNVQGEIRSIEGVKIVYDGVLTSVYGEELLNITIKATGSIRDYGVLIIEETIGDDDAIHPWHVVRFKNKILDNDSTISELITADDIKTIYSSWNPNSNEEFDNANRLGGEDGVEKVSIVLRWETEDNIKLYIADGSHYMFILNIVDDDYNEAASGDIDKILIYPRHNFGKILFGGLTSGTLGPSMVQYSYRLYNNNGISSEVSVPTRLIPIVYSKTGDFTDGKSISGGDSDDPIGVGVNMKINVEASIGFMNRILIYRILYLENGQEPQIDLISDFRYRDPIPDDDSEDTEILFSDTGLESLQTLTVDEFNSLSGVHIVPKVIESMNDYMFAANIRSEGGFTNDIFENFDARSYRFNLQNTAVLCTYTSGEVHNYVDGAIDLYDDVATDADCYNKYNNMHELFPETNEQDDDEYTSCRFTAEDENGDQYYGGTGKYVSWKFVVTELVGDSTSTNFSDPKNVFEVSDDSYNSDSGDTGDDDTTSGDDTVGNTDDTTDDADSSEETTNDDDDRGSIDNVDDGSSGTSQSEDKYHVGFNNNIIELGENQVGLEATCYYVRSDGELVEATDKFNLGQYLYQSYDGTDSYADPLMVYTMKSLKRDELYRYGIVLYDEQGNASYVKWIADIRTPSLNYKGFHTYMANVNNNEGDRVNLIVRPLGILFTVDIDKYNKDSDEKIAAYEIVRCNRSDADVVNVAQGIISRPIQRKLNLQANAVLVLNFAYTPTGLMTVGNFASVFKQKRFNKSAHSDEYGYESDNYDNYGIYQFVSPEVLYAKDSTYELLSNYSILLAPLRLIFGQNINYDPQYLKYNIWYSNHTYPSTYYGVSTALSNLNMVLPTDDDFYGPEITDSDKNDGYLGITDGKNRRLSIRQTSDVSPASYFWRYLWDYKIYKDDGTTSNSTNFHDSDWYYYYYLPGYGEPDDAIRSVVYGQRIYDSTKYISAYSKLYELSDDVILRLYPDLEIRRAGVISINETTGDQADLTAEQQQILLNSVVCYSEGYDRVKLSEKQYLYQINDVLLADELEWNSFIHSETNDDKTTYSFGYVDNQNSIMSQSYCNFVCGAAYNASAMIESEDRITNYQNNINKSLKSETADEAVDNYLFALGGRCLLIGLSDADNIIFKTIGTDTIKYYAEDKNGEELTWDLLNEKGLETSDNINTVYHSDDRGEDVDTNIMMNSLLSTYLCNIRRNINPYNSYSYINRTLDTYYSYGDLFEANSLTNYIFDGDCVIMPMEYISAHKTYPQTVPRYVTSCIIYSVPVETSILLGYTHGFEYSKNYQNLGITNILIEPANVNNIYTLSEALYTYNTVYSTNPTAKIYSALRDDEDDNSLTEIDYRCYHSDQKSNNESIDSWTTFQAANYIDVDTRYGLITNMRSFDNKLLFWLESALGVFSVNERSQITDDNDNTLTLGTAGILARYDYLDYTSGMHVEEYNDVQSPLALYWYDSHNKELKQYSDGIYQLNRLYGTENLINKYGNIKPILFYDDKYQELVGNVLGEGDSLAYNEQNKVFTSVYTVPFDEKVKFTNGVYLVQSDENNIKIAQWGVKENDAPIDLNSNVLHTKLEYVVNPSVSSTKVFDNLEIITPNKLYDETQLSGDYFTDNHNYTWKTDLGYTTSDELKMTYREGNFRYAIPRSGSAAYGNRMRGKYMVCSMEDAANDENAAISFIMTKYRVSWI